MALGRFEGLARLALQRERPHQRVGPFAAVQCPRTLFQVSPGPGTAPTGPRARGGLTYLGLAGEVDRSLLATRSFLGSGSTLAGRGDRRDGTVQRERPRAEAGAVAPRVHAIPTLPVNSARNRPNYARKVQDSNLQRCYPPRLSKPLGTPHAGPSLRAGRGAPPVGSSRIPLSAALPGRLRSTSQTAEDARVELARVSPRTLFGSARHAKGQILRDATAGRDSNPHAATRSRPFCQLKVPAALTRPGQPTRPLRAGLAQHPAPGFLSTSSGLRQSAGSWTSQSGQSHATRSPARIATTGNARG